VLESSEEIIFVLINGDYFTQDRPRELKLVCLEQLLVMILSMFIKSVNEATTKNVGQQHFVQHGGRCCESCMSCDQYQKHKLK
jgi:hypothetical protein